MISIGIHKFSNVLGFHPRNISGYIADFNAKYGNSIMTDTGGVIEWNNSAQLTPTEYNGQKASSLDGSTQYWSRALPTNLLTNGTFETGVNTDNWTTAGTVTFNDTELGKTGNYCLKMDGSAAIITKYGILTIGKKYKLALRYKSQNTLQLRNSPSGATHVSFPVTSQWNQVFYTFVATSIDFSLRINSGIAFIDDISITEDWKLDLNESYELIKHSNNRDFEDTDIAFTGAGNHSCARSTADKYAGTGSLLISASGAGSSGSNYVSLPSAQIDTLVSGYKYTIDGWARSDTASRTITAVIGGKSVTSATLSTTAGTFTKFVLNFLWEASDQALGQDLKFYLNGAGNVYVDNISLTQAYDRVFAKIIKPAVTEKRALHSFSSTNFAELKANGYLKSSVSDGTTTVANELSQYTTGAVNHLINILNRTDKLYWAVNNVVDAGTTATALGKIIHTAKLNIGANSSNAELFSGQYGAIAVIRFTRIEGSNFSGTTYRIGQSVTGGGAEVVLWHDWNNVTGAINYDKSLVGNNLTATASAENDIVTIKDYNSTYKLRQITKSIRPAYTDRAVVFTANDGLVANTTLRDIRAVIGRIYNSGVSQTVFEYNASDSVVLTGDGWFTLIDSVGTEINTTYNSNLEKVYIPINEWGYFVIAYDANIDASAFKLGAIGSDKFASKISHLVFFSTVPTSTEIQKVLNYMR